MATSDMPLASELSVVNYMRNILGSPSSGIAKASTVANTQPVIAGQASELSQDQLSTIMTEWLRGNGNFLGNMREQNVSGLYNTSTQRLMANDLTAQAALKAATANQDIQKANAQLTTSASNTNAQLAAQQAQANAKLATEVSMANAKAGTASRTDSLVNTALAAAMNMYKSSNNKSAKATSTKKSSTNQATTFDQSLQAANADSSYLLDPSYTNSSILTDPSYDFGMSALQSANSAGSNFDIPYMAPVDMGGFSTPTVSDFGQAEQSSYDFTPTAFNDSDFYGTDLGNYDAGSVNVNIPDTGPSISFDDDSWNIG